MFGIPFGVDNDPPFKEFCYNCGSTDFLSECQEIWLCEKCIFWFDYELDYTEEPPFIG